jgi:hypothetical protein
VAVHEVRRRRGTQAGTFYGGVVSQTDPDRPLGALTERLCNACRKWYRAKEHSACPHCGSGVPGGSKHERAGARKRILDAHLRGQAVDAARNR